MQPGAPCRRAGSDSRVLRNQVGAHPVGIPRRPVHDMSAPARAARVRRQRTPFRTEFMPSRVRAQLAAPLQAPTHHRCAATRRAGRARPSLWHRRQVPPSARPREIRLPLLLYCNRIMMRRRPRGRALPAHHVEPRPNRDAWPPPSRERACCLRRRGHPDEDGGRRQGARTHGKEAPASVTTPAAAERASVAVKVSIACDHACISEWALPVSPAEGALAADRCSPDLAARDGHSAGAAPPVVSPRTTCRPG
jgi:hypothetical protein